MISNGGFSENLAVLARRGAIPSDEQLEFERLIESSATLRAALVVGQDFDRIAAVQTGDEVRIARFVTGALEARKQQRVARFVRRRRSGWLLVAAVLSLCGVAYGLRGVYGPKTQPAPVPSLQEFGERTAPPGRSLAPIGQAATAAASSESEIKAEEKVTQESTDDNLVQGKEDSPKVSRPLPAATSPTAAEPESRVMDAPVSSNAVRLSAAGKFVEAAPSGADAATLLRQANSARSQGNSRLAISLFRELQQTCPNSLEAVLSHVSLGKLLAASGAAAAAIQEFTTYLNSGGPLAEEALFGRAQVLATLGRHGEEKTDLQALIARFPGSVYRAKAKERLQVLSHDTNR